MKRLFISTDPSLLNPEWIHDSIRSEPWGQGYTVEKVKRNLTAGLCFGVYERTSADEDDDGNVIPGTECESTITQVGFARVITDRVSTSVLQDVIIDAEHRGKGVGTLLMDTILAHPDVRETAAILATTTAWLFYQKFLFQAPAQPFMTRNGPKDLSAFR